MLDLNLACDEAGNFQPDQGSGGLDDQGSPNSSIIDDDSSASGDSLVLIGETVQTKRLFHGDDQRGEKEVKKSRRGPRSRSSQYRGVTFYRRTGRWESHIWDCGKQVYLGGFDTAYAAARAYDRAALKFRGPDADINFHVGDYYEDLQNTKNLTKEQFVHLLRRRTSGLSRGTSKFSGVTLHKCGRWEARVGQLPGNRSVYLGLFNSEVEAISAYDKAATKFNEKQIITNFHMDKLVHVSEMDMDGSDVRLDLSLSISQPETSCLTQSKLRNGTYIRNGHMASPETRNLQSSLSVSSSLPFIPIPLEGRGSSSMHNYLLQHHHDS